MDKVCVHGEHRRTGAPVLLELQPDSLTPDWLASVLLMVMVMVMRLRATYYLWERMRTTTTTEMNSGLGELSDPGTSHRGYVRCIDRSTIISGLHRKQTQYP